MLLSRSLPPQFLLPAWSTRQLLCDLQRAHSAIGQKPQRPSNAFLNKCRNKGTYIRQYGTSSSEALSQRERIARKHHEMKRLKASLNNKKGARIDEERIRPQHFESDRDRMPFSEDILSRKQITQSGATTFPHQKALVRSFPSQKGFIAPLRPKYEADLSNQKSDGSTDLTDGETMAWGISSFSMVREDANKPENTSIDKSEESFLIEQKSPPQNSLTEELPEDKKVGTQNTSTEAKRKKGAKSRESSSRDYTSYLDGESYDTPHTVQFGPAEPSGLERSEFTVPALDHIPSPKPEPTPKFTGSLFEELFPEESKNVKRSETTTVAKLPTFEWHEAPEIDWKETVEEAAVKNMKGHDTLIPAVQPSISAERHTKPQPGLSQRKSNLGVLVLKCASKTLEESDFFRLGSKGQHIEGWTSGITKVIQGRDSLTLEPLAHYYLVFSSEAAALAYLDNTIRLHRLSRTHGSGMFPLPIPAKFLRSGEDIKQVLRGYSLVPGQSHLSLHFVHRPYSPKVAQLLSDGGPAATVRQRTKAEDMVLLHMESSRISHFDLQQAINNDGKRRNLFWALKNGGRNAIMKINSDLNEHDHVDAASERYQRKNVQSPARYIISFKDTQEARRFVREWHRRPFPVQREHKSGDEPLPIMNVEMFR